VIKAALSGERLFVNSLRRLSRDAARHDAEPARLVAKAKDRLP